MDVAFILNKYFKGKENVSIDVVETGELESLW